MRGHAGVIGSVNYSSSPSSLFDDVDLIHRFDIHGASYTGSGTVLTDLDANPGNATLYNNPLYSNVGGVDCLRFDDVAYGHINSVSATDWTVDMWVRYYSSSTYYQRIWGMGGYRIEIALTNNILHFWDGSGWFSTGINLQPYTEWHKITVTYKNTGRTLRIYKNGVQVYTTGRGRTMASWGRICNSSDNRGAKVYLGEMNIYSKEQTAAQVLDNYNFNKATYGR